MEYSESGNENEKKKEYLRVYAKIVRRMKRSEERMQELRLKEMFPSVNMDGLPHAHKKRDLSDYSVMLERAEEQYILERYKRIQKCMEITKQIELLQDEDEKDVLFYRYIKCLKWEIVAEKMGYSVMQIHRIHGRALNHFKVL